MATDKDQVIIDLSDQIHTAGKIIDDLEDEVERLTAALKYIGEMARSPTVVEREVRRALEQKAQGDGK